MLGKTPTNPSGKAKLLAIAIALGGFGLQSNAQTLLGQWDFNDGFDPDDEFFIPATVGEALEITTDDRTLEFQSRYSVIVAAAGI